MYPNSGGRLAAILKAKMDKINKSHTELEIKYKVSLDDLAPFKIFIENNFNIEKFTFATGPDYYFVKPGTDDFIRFRFENYQTEDGELTVKRKRHNKNNFNRTEVNLKLKNPDLQDIAKFANLLGYEHNFTVIKDCYIFELSDCHISFYSVLEKNSKKEPLYFIEIEIKEDVVDLLTAKESWDLLKFYEKSLGKINISPKKRIKKSLFETFRK